MKRSDSLPMVLYPSRLRSLAIVAFGLAMLAFGLKIGPLWPRIAWCAVSAVIVLLGVALLLPSLCFLRLTQEGFAWRFARSRGSVRWSEVAEFGVITVPGAKGTRRKFVEFVYVRKYRELPSTQGKRYTFGGGAGYLPDSYDMKAEQLAELMNRLRRRYGGRVDEE